MSFGFGLRLGLVGRIKAVIIEYVANTRVDSSANTRVDSSGNTRVTKEIA